MSFWNSMDNHNRSNQSVSGMIINDLLDAAHNKIMADYAIGEMQANQQRAQKSAQRRQTDLKRRYNDIEMMSAQMRMQVDQWEREEKLKADEDIFGLG